MNAVWLFLYLGCLVRLLTLYRLDLHHPATLLMALPLLSLPVMDSLCRKYAWLLGKVAVRAAGLLALGSSLALARSLDLGFWETRHLGLAGLCALLGLGLSIVVQSLPRQGNGLGVWVWIAFWEYAGTWHPALTFVGAGLTAFLGAFGRWPEAPGSGSLSQGVAPFGAFLLLGLVLPKPWFDFNLEGNWGGAMAAFALAAGVMGLLQKPVQRLPNAVPLLLLGLAFFVYPTAWMLGWSASVGALWGILWVRLPQPLSRPRASFAFVLGLLLSFALHSNLGIPFLRRLLWWGS